MDGKSWVSLRCVWFEGKGGWDSAIHGIQDWFIHGVCLVGWIWSIFCLVEWMRVDMMRTID
jgi:hypothetical protein